jgi:hypothetical protein
MHSPIAMITADSTGYYSARLPIDHSRPPLYPILLHAASYLMGHGEVEFLSHTFFEDMNWIMALQIFCGILTCLMIYAIANILGIPSFISFLLAIVVSFDINVFSLEHVILTEAVSTCWLTGFTLISVQLIKKTSKRLIWIFIAMSYLGLLIKPVFLLLPFIVISIILYTHPTKKGWIYSIISVCIYVLFISVYIQLNAHVTGYAGISRISSINTLGKIMKYDIPLESVRSHNDLYTKMTTYRSLHGPPNPYRFLEFYDRNIYQHNERFYEIDSFNRTIIAANSMEYVLQSLKEIPAALLEPTSIVYINFHDLPARIRLFTLLSTIYTDSQYLFFLVLPGFFIFLALGLKNKTILNSQWFAVFAISIYLILTSVFFSYNEYGRLLSIVHPELYLCVMLLFSYRIRKSN